MKAIVFRAAWQLVGRAAEVAEPGAFLTAEVAGEPVLVVRDKEGALHALANVCRHRAARVECRSAGTASRFRCRYHGWAYDLSGGLAGAPEFEGVHGFDRRAVALPRYQVEVAGPFVFVHLGAPSESAAAAFAPVTTRSGDLGRFAFAARRVYEMRCNWKVFCDNYLGGGYHVPSANATRRALTSVDV